MITSCIVSNEWRTNAYVCHHCKKLCSFTISGSLFALNVVCPDWWSVCICCLNEKKLKQENANNRQVKHFSLLSPQSCLPFLSSVCLPCHMVFSRHHKHSTSNAKKCPNITRLFFFLKHLTVTGLTHLFLFLFSFYVLFSLFSFFLVKEIKFSFISFYNHE